MKWKKTCLIMAIAVMTMSATRPTDAGDISYRYISPDELREKIVSDEPMTILDIQVEEDFSQHHIKGAVPTYAYPVKTAGERARIDDHYAALVADSNPLVIVCPRGGGGARRTYDHLLEKGISEDRLLILEKGQGGWPYEDLLEK